MVYGLLERVVAVEVGNVEAEAEAEARHAERQVRPKMPY